MKYMGSKNRIAKHILSIILEGRLDGQTYVEPFVGGANMIDKVDDFRIGADVNVYLIEMLISLKQGWVPEEITKQKYLDVKLNPHKYNADFVGWVGFNCSYSGKWFGGFAGTVNTKIGTVRNYQEEAIRNATEQAKLLKGVKFVCSKCNDLDIPDHSIIYCDPPYEGTTTYRDKFDHSAFWRWCRVRSSEGHKVFISEYNAPTGFSCVWEKEIKSSLSANGKCGGSKSSTERLFAI